MIASLASTAGSRRVVFYVPNPPPFYALDDIILVSFNIILV